MEDLKFFHFFISDYMMVDLSDRLDFSGWCHSCDRVLTTDASLGDLSRLDQLPVITSSFGSYQY